MTQRASFTAVVVDCYSTVGDRLQRLLASSERMEEPNRREVLFITQIFVLAALVVATPILFVWASMRWYRLSHPK